MKIIECSIPDMSWHSGNDFCSLDEYDLLDDLRKYHPILVAYWYVNHGYGGNGHFVAKFDDGWRMHDMSHCSCYGATDGFDPTDTPHKTLDDLINSCSDELKKEMSTIFKELKRRRYI